MFAACILSKLNRFRMNSDAFPAARGPISSVLTKSLTYNASIVNILIAMHYLLPGVFIPELEAMAKSYQGNQQTWKK